MSASPKDEKSIFAAAVALRTPAERQAYLDEACGSDVALKAGITALLRAREDQTNFLNQFIPAPESVLNDFVEVYGTVVGRYKLLEKIGEGGMAVVYMAEQEQPIRRKVALKIIKLGMDTKQVIARFEAERQALAMMDHPNIAKVFDAGATETGRPYFVMELVHGVRITDFCDQHGLDTRQRLELLVQVCHAVQHAHQKGVIHRDIKPSNVLVTLHDDKPVPKVIDFGIAKATNQRLTEKTLFTRYAHMIGTPTYMSPEQAQMSGLDVDTRTDIYSLGVLLYELLTGTTPFDTKELADSSLDKMIQIIREREPQKPSTRLSQTRLTSGKSSALATRHSSLATDLDWIALKCLEKDRIRRYETAHGLAQDIECYLRDEPILARSPSIFYRLGKFMRRHRSRIAISAVVSVLLAGAAVTAAMYRRASTLRWVKGEALPKIVEFIKAGDYRAAFPLAQKAAKYIPQDPTLRELWSRICKDYSISTIPAGAEIWCRGYAATDDPWQYLGRSPLKEVTLPQGTYRWRIAKRGFATHECVIDHSFSVRLREGDLAGDMVWIDAWTAEIQTGSPGTSTAVEVPSYLIDRYEVTNEQYQVFVDAGGYETAAYWEELDFVKDGRHLLWQEAIAEFRDQTGQFGPATWKDGTYPNGQAGYPVSGVSWFEANAYARFAGRSLPTVHHWERAACLFESLVIVPYSNFGSEGTAPVGSHMGTGHTGLFDMAGNVKEWCWNATGASDSHRYVLGGGWGEQTYMFTMRDSRSPWDRSETNGFRCVRYPEQGDLVSEALRKPIRQRVTRDYSTEAPCSDEEYMIIKRQFAYDRTPLNAVVEEIDDSSPFWRKEEVTFDAAYGEERVIAYLFTPRSVQPPYQTVVYSPGGGTSQIPTFTDLPQRDFTELIITGGRALMFPVYKGSFQRRFTKWPDPRQTPLKFRDLALQAMKDMRRSIDYLETRDDIDHERIAYYGMSGGAVFGPLALAIEQRFKAAVLVVGGFYTWIELPAAADPLNHAPRVKTPVLMVNGNEDYFFPVETSQVPMFELLGTPNGNKEHKLYPGGHGLLGLFSKQIRADVLGWLDRYLGPVNGRTNSTK